MAMAAMARLAAMARSHHHSAAGRKPIALRSVNTLISMIGGNDEDAPSDIHSLITPHG